MKFCVQLKRVRHDYLLVQVEADSAEQAGRKALALPEASLDSKRYCDGQYVGRRINLVWEAYRP